MRYYMDIDGDYYYLEESGKKVYDDKVMDPINDASDEAGGSSSGLLYADLKSCLYELVGKILADNQIREERIMARIDSMVKESEESQVKLKNKLKYELKVGMQASEARVTSQVDFVRVVVDHLGRSNVILNIFS